MTESFLVGVLSAAIAMVSMVFLGGMGMTETAAVAMLAGGGASSCMIIGQT